MTGVSTTGGKPKWYVLVYKSKELRWIARRNYSDNPEYGMTRHPLKDVGVRVKVKAIMPTSLFGDR